ncbi:MAG: DUF177 domain-containing protein [Dehalococcoidales bacterium]|nr:DUF177 domain-containing protein [Dehalococcoidales bacterium]
MQVNVSQLLQEPIGATRAHSVDGKIDVFGDGKFHAVRGDIKLLRTNRSILVEGMLTTEVELVCSRCLSDFQRKLTLNIEEEFVPTIDVHTGAPLLPPEDPVFFTIDERHVIDFTEAIRQYALLAVPMKPLCRENCPGLCPSCGSNLNQGKCNCAEQKIDPRWAELAKLLK